MCADGGFETATAEETGAEPGSDNRPLFFYRPDVADDEAWPKAQRPDLPLRNKKGEVVDRAQWGEEFSSERASFGSNSINASAAGALPAYRLPPELRPRSADSSLEFAVKELRAATRKSKTSKNKMEKYGKYKK